MNREEILQLLNCLNRKLKIKNLTAELFILGGSALTLCYNQNRATKDIDALFTPKEELYPLIAEIAEEKGLADDWLNDSVKGFADNLDCEFFDSFSNLKIYVGSAEYLLAMKCLSCRLDSSKDKDDIKFLINYLHLNDPEEVYKILLRYFPENYFDIKTQLLIEELFSNSNL